MDAFGKVSGQLDRFQNKVTGVFRSIVNLPNILVGTGAALAVKSFLAADMQLEAMENRLSAAVGKFTDSAEELKYLRQEADRVGIRFTDLATSYSGFAAATTRAGISVEKTRQIFKEISETAVSLKLSPERVKLVFTALEQMASKGVVSMEELRRQLGDSFPAAMEIGARAMNMGTQEFNKLVSTGTLLSAEFLPRFSKQVREELGGSFDVSREQLQANLARMSNAFFDLRQAAGEALSPIANEILEKLKVKMGELKVSIEENKGKITEALSKIPGYFDKILNSASSFVKFMYEHREVIYLVGLSLAFAKAVVAINNFRIAFIALNIAMASNPILAVAAALVSLGVVAGLTSKNAEEWKKELGSNAELRDRAEQIETLYVLMGKYNSRMEDAIEFNEKDITVIGPNDKLDSEIKTLEGTLGNFGIALQGGLISKLEQAQQKLDELQGKVKNTAATVSQAYQQIAPQKTDTDTKRNGQNLSLGTRVRYEQLMAIDIKDEARLKGIYSVWGKNAIAGINEALSDEQNKLLQETFLKLLSFNADVLTVEQSTAQRRADLWKDTQATIESTLKSSFMTLISLEGTFTDKMKSIFSGLYNTFMSILYDYLAEYIKVKLYEQTVGIATEKKKQAENVTTAYTSAAGAGAGAAESVSKVPYIGPILAVAALATVFGAIAAVIGNARQHARGTDYAQPGWSWVGERGPELRYIGGGEKIIPNDKISGMGGDVNISLTVNGNMDERVANKTVSRLQQISRDIQNAIRFKYLNPALLKG
jgi:tape measure domain-containing protein